MKSGHCILVLCCILGRVSVGILLERDRRNVPQEPLTDWLTCTKEYQNIDGHTLCLTDSPSVTKSGVTAEDKLLITEKHNSLRAIVEPPATDLVKLIWDDRLAAVAQKWANQCKLEHDTDDQRYIPELGLSVGQNVAAGSQTWLSAIQNLYDEISLFQYGRRPSTYLDVNKTIGHFTQIVQNGTYMVGCGFAECPFTKYVRYYVCNYAAGQTNLAYPYTAGSRCEACPNNCKNGLCDCSGRVCLNGGKLNPDTCQCTCSQLYKGDTCEILSCPAVDDMKCGDQYPKRYCNTYSNFPGICPYMCGVCGDGTSMITAVNPT